MTTTSRDDQPNTATRYAASREYTRKVKDAARGHWHEIIPAITGIPREHLDGKQYPCILNGGNTKQRAYDDFAETGGMHCNDCGPMPDGFEVVKRVLRCSFETSRKRIADVVGVKSPSKEKKEKKGDPADELQRLPWTESIASHFTKRKEGITEKSIVDAGGFAAIWCNRVVIAFPIIGESLDTDKPIGYVLTDGASENGKINVGEPSNKKTIGSGKGLIGLAGIRRLKAGSVPVCIKTEGLTDMLALMSAVPDTSVAYYAIVSNACGATQEPRWMAATVAKAERTIIAHDADTAGRRGVEKWIRGILVNDGTPLDLILPYEIVAHRGKDVRDFLNDGHSFADAIELAKPAANDGRSEVLVTADEHDACDLAAAQLHRDADIFQRGGRLVQVLNGVKTQGAISRSVTNPQIAEIRHPTLRYKLSKLCYFVQEVDDGKGNVFQEQIKPPKPCVDMVFDKNEWPGVPPLTGIALSPFIQHDGTILATRGYDAGSGIYLAGDQIAINVPEHPSRHDAQLAVAALLEIVCDFPFERPEHASAWLSSLLTPLARHTFDGPTPLHLIDANVRGSGKTKLADIISLTIHGERIARMTNPRDDEEARKAITAIALAGDPLVLIDNISGYFGGASWDALLTATRWQDRLLSKNEMINLPLLTCWLASGNNIVLRGDIIRRVLHVRLQSPLERPELRTGFKYGDIERHVKENRGRLLSAALTILRAFFVAGKPQQKIPEWGSYGEWSSVVRQALVFAGQPDPAETRQDFVESSDQEAISLRLLVNQFGIIDPDCRGLTVSEIIAKIREPNYRTLSTFEEIEAKQLYEETTPIREAIIDLCNTKHGDVPNSKQLGCKLRQLRDRVVDGLKITSRPDRTGIQRWRVTSSQVISEPSPASSAGQSDADDAGDADDVYQPLARELVSECMYPIHRCEITPNMNVAETSSASSASSALSDQWVNPDYASEAF